MQEMLELPLAVASKGADGALNVASRVDNDFCIVVYGQPQPAGSKTGFAIKAGPKGHQHYTGKVGMADGRTKGGVERHKSWRSLVTEMTREVMAGAPPVEGACEVWYTICLLRPKGHYLTGGGLSAAGRRMPYPAVRPDGGKYQRSLDDSLTDGGLWRDDSVVTDWHGRKRWAEPGRIAVDILEVPGVIIRIRSLL